MASRYQPLGDYLAALPPETTRITLTLAEMEAILGDPLPRHASTAVWWSNTARLQRARAWMGARWFVTVRSFRVAEPAITFERASDATR